MSKGNRMVSLLVVFICLTCGNVSAFAIYPGGSHARAFALQGAKDSDDNGASRQQAAETTESFMERASRDGAEKVRTMTIAERTKRAMLAEAIEDRIFSLNDDLELLLETNGIPLPENREKVKMLVREIKSSEDQYAALVSGNPSSMLRALESLDNALDSDSGME